MANNKRDDRTRNWIFILYPESAPENWRDVIDELHIQWAESPLHDCDKNADGSPKKPHYHILLTFDGNKSFSQICEITEKLCCPIPQKCQNVKGTVRYFVHMDDPDKYQYDRDKIVSHGGFDVASNLRATSSDRYSILREIVDFVRTKEIIEYADLVEYALMEHPDDWFPLLADTSTLFISTYITSLRNKYYRAKKLNIDPVTGEITEK